MLHVVITGSPNTTSALIVRKQVNSPDFVDVFINFLLINSAPKLMTTEQFVILVKADKLSCGYSVRTA